MSYMRRSTITLLAGTAATAATAVTAYLAHRALLTEARNITATLHALSGRVGADYWRVYDHVQRDLLLNEDAA